MVRDVSDAGCDVALEPGQMMSILKLRGTTWYRFKSIKLSTDNGMVNFSRYSSIIGAHLSIEISVQQFVFFPRI